MQPEEEGVATSQVCQEQAPTNKRYIYIGELVDLIKAGGL